MTFLLLFRLLHAQADPVALLVHAQYHHIHHIAHLYRFAGVLQPAGADLLYMY